MGDIVVYTAVTGGRDELRPPLVIEKGTRYVCFTDQPTALKGRGWELVPVSQWSSLKDARSEARLVKVHPFTNQVAAEALALIWVDGHIVPKISPRKIVEEHLLPYGHVAAFAHRERTCAYDEAACCHSLGLLTAKELVQCEALLERTRFPRGYGLHETGILVWRPTVMTRSLMRYWFTYTAYAAWRDQVTFDMCCYLLGLKCRNLSPGNVKDNPYFEWYPHKPATEFVCPVTEKSSLPEPAAAEQPSSSS